MNEKSNALERARAMGIDVELLRENLRLTVTERVRRNAESVRLIERTRRANFTPEQLERLRQREIDQLRANWGEWLAPLDAL